MNLRNILYTEYYMMLLYIGILIHIAIRLYILI